MTEITQADREAAAVFYGTWGGTKGWQHLEEPIREGIVDDNALVQSFARHRHQARAEVVGEIVAWLREDGGAEYYDGTTIATDIEAKFGCSDAGRSA